MLILHSNFPFSICKIYFFKADSILSAQIMTSLNSEYCGKVTRNTLWNTLSNIWKTKNYAKTYNLKAIF